jgi:hypothetical protein
MSITCLSNGMLRLETTVTPRTRQLAHPNHARKKNSIQRQLPLKKQHPGSTDV